MASSVPRVLIRTLLAGFVLAGTVELAAVAQPQTPPPTQTQQSTPPPAPPQQTTPPPQTAPPPVPGAVATDPAAAPATPVRPAPPADQRAWQEAQKISDPTAKLESMRKLLANHPGSTGARLADDAILDLLLNNWPDRRDEIEKAVDKVVANIPSSTPADFRLNTIQTLVNKLADKKVLLDKAETLVGSAMEALDTQFKSTRARAIELLAVVHMSKGDASRAEKEFKEAFAANSTLTRAPVELAQLEVSRGNERAALDYYLPLAANGKLKASDEAKFRSLYKKVHGNTTNLDDEIDRVYRKTFPNPVKVEAYKPTGARTGRVVLAEMFTGSGCPPCVSADLALEAVMQRYPADTVAVLAYHANIPAPDPMVVSGADARRKYYGVTGVPTIEVDGVGKVGGGARDAAPRTYSEYVAIIDKALEAAPRAAVTLQATTDGTKVKVTATASNIASDAKNVRLHIVLAEHELRFTGENGIRFHPMTVRGVAGQDAAGFAVEGGETKAEWTFDLAQIGEDVTKTLADEIGRRRKTETATPPREYRAEGQAMTAINASELVVIAYVQDGDKKVMQAAKAEVKQSADSKR